MCTVIFFQTSRLRSKFSLIGKKKRRYFENYIEVWYFNENSDSEEYRYPDFSFNPITNSCFPINAFRGLYTNRGNLYRDEFFYERNIEDEPFCPWSFYRVICVYVQPPPGIRNRESMRNWKIPDSEGQSSPVTCEFWKSREVEWVTPSPSLHKNTLTRCDIHFLLSWVVPRRWASRKIEKFQIKMLHCVFHTRQTLSARNTRVYIALLHVFLQFCSRSNSVAPLLRCTL